MALVALTFGQGEANPKDALALIFGILGVFIVLLFTLQTHDISEAEAADAHSLELVPAEIDNPATLDEPTLWATMAIRPIDADAVRARKQIWRSTRQSIRTGMLICALIFVTVPPVYLLDTFLPLIVGVPAIVGVALWKSGRLLTSGGELDQAYERANRAMAPLGLTVAERPQVTIETRSAAPPRVGSALHGALVLAGERHGHQVTVQMPAGEGIRSASEVRLATNAPAFQFRARDGRLEADDGAPPAIREALEQLPNSQRWNGVRGTGDKEGIVVERTGVKGDDWVLDLWLAERLADV